MCDFLDGASVSHHMYPAHLQRYEHTKRMFTWKTKDLQVFGFFGSDGERMRHTERDRERVRGISHAIKTHAKYFNDPGQKINL